MRNTDQLALIAPSYRPQIFKNLKNNLSDCSEFLLVKNALNRKNLEASTALFIEKNCACHASSDFKFSQSNHFFNPFFNWHLHHRSPSALELLARAAGLQADQIQVKKEPLCINLFLHLQGARNA